LAARGASRTPFAVAARDPDHMPLHGIGRRDGGNQEADTPGGDDHTGPHAFGFAAGLAGEMDKILSKLP